MRDGLPVTRCGSRGHSGLMARITLPHFSLSSAMSFPNSAGVIGIPARCATILGGRERPCIELKRENVGLFRRTSADLPLSLVTLVTLSNEPSAADSVPVTSAAQSLLLPTVSRRCPCARGIQAVWGGGAWNLLPFQVRVGRLEAALLPLGNARNRLLPFLPSHSCGRLCTGRGCAGRRLRRRWRWLSVPCRRQQRREAYRHEADSSQAPMPADCSCHILPPNIFEDRQRPVRSPPPLMERRRPRSVLPDSCCRL